jgi:hypothetical protein
LEAILESFKKVQVLVLKYDGAFSAYGNSVINEYFVCPQPMPTQYETGMVKLERRQNFM